MTEKQASDRYTSSSIVPKLEEIYDLITWGDFARKYFPDHSVSWFYNKLRGVDGNGGLGGFTAEELAQLRASLIMLADSIRSLAGTL